MENDFPYKRYVKTHLQLPFRGCFKKENIFNNWEDYFPPTGRLFSTFTNQTKKNGLLFQDKVLSPTSTTFSITSYNHIEGITFVGKLNSNSFILPN